MANVAVDTAYLAASYAIPEPTFRSIIDEPTKDLVQNLLIQLQAKAQEHDATIAEKLRTEVELETVTRHGEERAKALKASVDRSLEETAELRKKLHNEENARQALEQELQNLKSSTSSSTSELKSLQSRIIELETSNRKTVDLLQTKSNAHDKLAEDLSEQHQKFLALRKQVSDLEEKNQTLQNATMSAKFREESQKQEIVLLKNNADHSETELRTRNAEYAKYRKEKGARIAELQRANEDAAESVESLKRTENTLRKRIEELTQRTEEAWTTKQKLEEEASRVTESHRIDLENAQRLSQLQKQSADTARARLQEVERTLAQLREDASAELGQLHAEVDTERSGRESGEQRIAELESQIEQLEARIAAAEHARSVPATPRRGLNSIGTPGRSGSPRIFTPGSSRMKGNGAITNTQLYAENSELKGELAAQRRRCQQLSDTLDDFVRDLESKQPEIDELKAEQERLTTEVMDISALLDEAIKERESAAKESRKWQGQVEGSLREANLLRQQLRDLSSQMRILLVEIQARDQGLQNLNEEQRQQFEQIAQGQMDESALDGMTEIGQYISQRLVIFKSVAELQQQNVDLLKITRELGDRMEGEEALAKADQQKKDKEELEGLRERCERYQDEVKSLNTRSQSYIKERDMYRRMLTQRGQSLTGPDLAAQFSQSVDSRAPNTDATNTESQSQSKDGADYATLFKELQVHLDALKQEAETDHASLKQQVDKLAKEKGSLQVENSKVTSQLSLEHQRYELLNSNFAMFKTENVELQKRAQHLMEVSAKQELRTQQAAEDLVEAKALADSTRNEVANLKAEKELWKRIESRLSEDNNSLVEEKRRLNKLVSDLQNLQNERELSESENRRRLQNKIDALEAELNTVKRQLVKEVEDGKNATLRREYEQEKDRARIDDLMKNQSNVREELIAAKTQRDHLQARVDDMKIELQNAQSRAEALQPRPTTRPEAVNADAEMVDPNALSREQELAVELADLTRDLEHSKAELAAANGRVEDIKAISQQAEEDLESLTQTHDLYITENDAIHAQKDEKIADLEKRVEEITSELASTSSELSQLQSSYAEIENKFKDERTGLESEIARVKDQSDRYQETAKLHQEDLKAQAQIAQQAQQSYENELVKHADAAKALQKVRADFNQLKTEVAGVKAEADSARQSLTQSEESWSESKERYEHEIGELKTRREEINNQNRLLHQQLESVSKQIATLKQSRNYVDREGDTAIALPDLGTDSLQEVIRYLRREKEIVDVQYEMSIQEQKRLRQQLEHAQSQLDETREKLSQERQSQLDKEQNAVSHNKLMETINELNVFRESSTTLRNEARQAQAQLAEKAKEMEGLYERVQPLEAKVQELESELESKIDNIGLLEKLRDELQQRNQNILSKYNRIDPAEHEGLKSQIESLQSERDELIAAKQPLQERIDAHAEELRLAIDQQSTAFADRRERMTRQFKEKVAEEKVKLNAVTNEKNDLSSQLDTVRAELQSTKQARDEAIARAQAQQDTQTGNGMESGEVDEDAAGLQTKLADAEACAAGAETRAADAQNNVLALQGQVEGLQARIVELEQRIATLQQQLDANSSELSATRIEPSDMSLSTSELETLKSELATVKQENETLRATGTGQDSTSKENTDSTINIAEEVTKQVDAIKATLEAQHAERLAKLEGQFKQRTDNMKSQLNTKMREKNEALAAEREKWKTEHSEEIARLNSEHEAAISRLNAEHNAKIQSLQAGIPAAAPPANVDGKAPVQDTATVDSSTQSPRADVLKTLTDPEVKDLIAKNPTVNSIIKRNIQTKLAAEKESVTNSLKAEHEKALEHVKQEAASNLIKGEAKLKSTETMMQKRWEIKLSALENQRNLAQMKVGIVETAAKATPQKPVAEVWDTAKDVKLPPKKPQTAAAPGSATTPNTASSLNTPQKGAPQSTQPLASSPANPAVVPNGQGQQTQSQNTTTAPIQPTPTSSLGNMAAPPATPQTSAFSGIVAPNQNPNQFQQNAFHPPEATMGGTFGLPSSLPQTPFQGQMQGLPPNPTAGRGGNLQQRGNANNRGGMVNARNGIMGVVNQNAGQNVQSMIPRVGQNTRGRGRGAGRGGAPGAGQSATNESPGQMNPGAQHFVPRGGAQKRAHEDVGGDQAQKRRKDANEGGAN